MRKCIKCGKELPEGVLFCLECGASQDPRLAPTPRRRVPLLWWIVAAAAVLIVTGAGVALALRPSPTRQDPPPETDSLPLPQTAERETLVAAVTETGTADEPETNAPGPVETVEPTTDAPDPTAPVSPDKTVPDHVHSYVSSVTREATCTAGGRVRYSCACGASYTENTPALGHDMKDEVTRAATCAAAGELTHRCTRCGAATTETIPLAEHRFALTSGTAATCLAPSSGAVYTCSVCGKTENRDEAALGHTTSDGTCDRCGACCHGDIAVYVFVGTSLHYYDSQSGVPLWFYVKNVSLSSRGGALYMSGTTALKPDAPVYYASSPYSGRVRAYIQNQYKNLTVISRTCEVIPAGTPAGGTGVFDGVYLTEWSTLENYGGKTFYLRFDDAGIF